MFKFYLLTRVRTTWSQFSFMFNVPFVTLYTVIIIEIRNKSNIKNILIIYVLLRVFLFILVSYLVCRGYQISSIMLILFFSI